MAGRPRGEKLALRLIDRAVIHPQPTALLRIFFGVDSAMMPTDHLFQKGAATNARHEPVNDREQA
jgi:hypothetical protein